MWVKRFQSCHAGSPAIRANTFTPNHQTLSSIAADAAGNFIVIWKSRQDGSGEGIFAQRFDGDDNPVGAEYLVNTYTTALNGSRRLR